MGNSELVDKTYLKVSITKSEFYQKNFRVDVIPNEVYEAITEIKANKGKQYCSYFVIIQTDQYRSEITRHIRWINNFDRHFHKYRIIFTTSNTTSQVIIGYKFNRETPMKVEIEAYVKDPSMIQLRKVSNMKDSYNDLNKFEIEKFSLSADQEDLLEKRMVWVFGSSRSGSTWLGTQLLRHPDNVIWDEPYIGRHFEMVKPWQEKRGRRYFFSPSHKNNWLQWLRKLILARTFSEFQTVDKNVIIKEPNSSEGCGIILGSLPNSKLIFLLRDGRDVVDSQIDAFKKGSWNEGGTGWIKNTTREKRIRLFSHSWTQSIESVFESFQKHDSKLKILVKYEDLLTNTLAELRKIYDFLQINVDDRELKKIIEKYDFNKIPSKKRGPGKFFRSAKVGGYKDNFSEKEQEIMISKMGETLKKAGYV